MDDYQFFLKWWDACWSICLELKLNRMQRLKARATGHPTTKTVHRSQKLRPETKCRIRRARLQQES